MNWINCPTTRREAACGVRGRSKKKIESEPELVQNLKSVLEIHTAGDPDDEEFLWTDFSPAQLAEQVANLGTPVSPRVVRDWLEDEGLALHKIAKVLAGGGRPIARRSSSALRN